MNSTDDRTAAADPTLAGHSRRRRRWAAAVVGVLLVALIAGLVVSTDRPPRDGLILVDAPEIYTRERLVNDRFMQRSWLLGLLSNPPDRVALQQRTSRDTGLEIAAALSAVGGNRPEPPAAGQDAEGNEDVDDGTAPSDDDVDLSAIDRFRLELAYRTEVRQSLLETMLDDGHDLDGNTLYMLKFDVAVIPPSRTDEVALVVAELERPQYRPDGEDCAEASAADDPDIAGVPCERQVHGEIYRRWVERIRESSSGAFVARYRSFLTMQAEESDLLDLLRGTERDFAQSNGAPLRNGGIVQGLRNLDGFLELYNRLQLFHFDLRQVRSACAANRGLPRDPRRLPPGERPPDDYGYYAAPLPRGDAVGPEGLTLFDLMPKLRYLMLEFGAHRLASAPDSRAARTYSAWETFAWELGSADADSGYSAWERRARWLLANWPRYRRCPPTATSASTAATSIDGFEAAFARCCVDTPLAGAPPAPSAARWPSSGPAGLDAFIMQETNAFYRAARKAWAEERFLLQQQIGRLIREELTQSLGDFLHFGIDCTEYPKLCRLTVNEGGCPQGGEPPLDCRPTSAFRAMLRRGATWTYAATPKEQADAVLTSMRTRSALRLISELALKQAPGVDAAAEVLMRQDAADTDAGRRVHVMGFSDVAGKYDETATDPVTVKADGGTAALFGWFIRPRERGGELQALQQSLNAIVSVPSWWRGVSLQVRTCWRSPDNVPQEEATLGKVCRDAVPEQFPVRLPWTVSELRRTLGYQIRRYPFVESINGAGPDDPSGADFFVDQPNATLLIEGGELWRSTTVTLGAQRASEITVLPNMRGIVARFDRIQWPSQLERRRGAPSCRVEVPIRVWTSEGSTESTPLTKALIWLREDDYLAGNCVADTDLPRPASGPPANRSGPPPTAPSESSAPKPAPPAEAAAAPAQQPPQPQ